MTFFASGIKITPNDDGVHCGECRGQTYTPRGPAWNAFFYCQFFDQSLTMDTEMCVCSLCHQSINRKRDIFRCKECLNSECATGIAPEKGKE